MSARAKTTAIVSAETAMSLSPYVNVLGIFEPRFLSAFARSAGHLGAEREQGLLHAFGDR